MCSNPIRQKVVNVLIDSDAVDPLKLLLFAYAFGRWSLQFSNCIFHNAPRNVCRAHKLTGINSYESTTTSYIKRLKATTCSTTWIHCSNSRAHRFTSMSNRQNPNFSSCCGVDQAVHCIPNIDVLLSNASPPPPKLTVKWAEKEVCWRTIEIERFNSHAAHQIRLSSQFNSMLASLSRLKSQVIKEIIIVKVHRMRLCKRSLNCIQLCGGARVLAVTSRKKFHFFSSTRPAPRAKASKNTAEQRKASAMPAAEPQTARNEMESC